MSTFPSTLDAITAAWLTSVLPADLRDGAAITGFTPTLLSAGTGFVGEVAHLALAYDRPRPASVPSVIAKVPTSNEGFRRLGQMLGLFRKAISFYRSVAPTLDVRVPAAYFMAGDEETAAYVMLLEDLAGMSVGDQLASCSRQDAEVALREIAKLHARWWNDPQLANFADWLPGVGDPYFAMLEAAYQAALPRFADAFGHMVDPKIIDFAHVVGARYGETVQAGSGRGQTFTHGDYRLDNLMFGDGVTAPRIAVIDWQLPRRATALCDVVYFVAGNFDVEWRRAHERELLRSYYDALLEGGVPDYSFERCWEDYRAAALILMGYMVTGAGDIDPSTFNERGRRLFEAMFSRYSTAILDLESWDFLGS